MIATEFPETSELRIEDGEKFTEPITVTPDWRLSVLSKCTLHTLTPAQASMKVVDFRLHIYDTAAPPIMTRDQVSLGPDADHETTMKVMRSIDGMHGGWTITDSHLSPDNERIIYSSMVSICGFCKIWGHDLTRLTVYIAKTRDTSPSNSLTGEPFHTPRCARTCSDCFHADSPLMVMRLWQLAGGSGQIFDKTEKCIVFNRRRPDQTLCIVYDLLGMRRTTRIVAHEDDVNSCCWADSASGNVLISASDDSFLKVWAFTRCSGQTCWSTRWSH
jgi:WD repeat-containing protein 23